MRSLRFQLIFWNTAILACVLIAVAGTIAWLNLQRMDQGISRELVERSRGGRMGQFQRGRPQGEGQNANGPDPNQQGPGPAGEGPLGGRGQNMRPGAQFQKGPGFRDAESERIGSIRRPRVMDRSGTPLVGPPQEVPLDPIALKSFKGEPIFTETTFQNERIRVYTTKGPPNFGEDSVLQVARELRDYRELARVQWVTLLTVLPFGILLAALGGRFLTTRAMRPIGAMGQAASDIGSGQFERRIPVAGDDEFAQLGRQFNTMAEHLGLSFEQQKQAFAQLEASYENQRRFVADASHELRTPLTRLQLVTSEALADPSADQRRAVEIADQSAQAMANLVRQLLELARADSGELKPHLETLDIRALIADVVEALPWREQVQLKLPEHPVELSVDPSQIARALINLLENAKRHSPPESPIHVLATDEGGTTIRVQDEGDGIPAEHLPRVTERFYRVDEARTSGGAGLGLAIVSEIMRAHGGALVVESELGVGTRASLVFKAQSA